jgi:hypothetical protein
MNHAPGDPQLHDHVVVANKVKGADGRWRSIDGALLYKSAVAASEVYNSRLVEKLHDRLGVQFESREREGKRPVLEVKGISDDLMRDFSSRRESITPVLNRLVDDYTRQHGRAPSKKQMMKLAQQATLDTRPEKEGGKTLGELRESWAGRAHQFMTSKDIDHLVADVTTVDPEQETPSIDVDEIRHVRRPDRLREPRRLVDPSPPRRSQQAALPPHPRSRRRRRHH